jgi:hypothetical protein
MKDCAFPKCDCNHPCETSLEFSEAYTQGYRDAIDDAMRSALMAQVGNITTHKEFCLRHEIVEEIRSLRGTAK